MINASFIFSSQAEAIAAVIVVFACVLWITEWIPIYATSFLLLFLEIVWLLPELQTTNPNIKSEIFLAPFFSDTVLLFLGGFVISSALQKYKLDILLANRIIYWNRSSPIKLLYAIVFSTSFLSCWMNNTATASLMIGIVIPIIEKFPDNSGWRKAFILAIPFASNIGGMGTPVGTLPNALAIEYLSSRGMEPSFLEWILLALPLILILNIIMVSTLRFIFCRGEALELILPELSVESINGKSGKYFVIFTTILTIIGWLSSSIHSLSNGTIAIIPIVLYFGLGYLDKNDFRNLAWDVLILLGGGISMGKALEATGLAKNLINSIPWAGESVFSILVIFSLISIFLSSIMSNTATANLVIPIAMSLSIGEASGIVIIVALSASLAMPLPISTPPNAIAFGYGILRSRDMSIPGAVITFFGFCLVVTLGYYLLKFLKVGGF